ncbi:nitroreductase family protein [Ideonella margarita]|uniref:Nitroreductase family protein n=1 Tax=Ideonella margarita TaxID=2984191 RepID=A0ABU9C5Z2_9BURK
MSIKQALKSALKRWPALWTAYWRVKQQFKRAYMLRYFSYDIKHTYRAMFWPVGQLGYRPLAASLFFQYHKLEKGLVMPGPRRLFGLEPAQAVMEHLERWHAAGHSQSDSVYRGAMRTLHDYMSHLEAHGLDPAGQITPVVKTFLAGQPSTDVALSTPVPLAPILVNDSNSQAVFAGLVAGRRSVREFAEDDVPRSAIEQAIQLAQMSPSACNRQPCRVHALHDAQAKKQALQLQNGNRGFGHLAPWVLVITADETGFFDASERHQPYIDGGLFAMTLQYALTAQGLASCCLNWCTPPENDRRLHAALAIPDSERVMMLLAVGMPAADCRVPRSPRRDLKDVLRVV